MDGDMKCTVEGGKGYQGRRKDRCRVGWRDLADVMTVVSLGRHTVGGGVQDRLGAHATDPLLVGATCNDHNKQDRQFCDTSGLPTATTTYSGNTWLLPAQPSTCTSRISQTCSPPLTFLHSRSYSLRPSTRLPQGRRERSATSPTRACSRQPYVRFGRLLGPSSARHRCRQVRFCLPRPISSRIWRRALCRMGGERVKSREAVAR
jgi:hypothetical protein